MAQVNIQKLQSGGSTKKYGTFTKDGVTYQVDDDFLQAMTAHGSSITDERARANYGAIVNALRSGADLSYNSNTNELRGDVSFNNLTDRQKKRAAKRTSKTGESIDRLFNNRVNQVKVATDALRNFNYNQTAPATRNTNQSVDVSRRLYLNYERDEDGNLVLDENNHRKFIPGTYNSAVFDRLDFLKNLANERDIVDWKGYENQTKDAYLNFIQNYNDWDGLKQRIKDGSITDNDVNILAQIGILDRDSSSESETKEPYEKRGLDYQTTSPFVTIDPNTGELNVTDEFNSTFGTGNSIFNDWWEESLVKSGNWDPNYSWLKGYTRVGNKLYKTEDLNNPESQLYKFAHVNGGFYDLNNQNRFEEANKILNYLWGRSDKSSKWDSVNLYSPWLNGQDSSFRYRSLTGTRKLPEGQQLIEYWSGNERDQFGRPSQYKYALLDSKGNLINDNVDIDAFEEIEGDQIGLTALQRIVQGNSPYNGRYVVDFSDPSGIIGNYSLYINPDNLNDVILQSDELNRWSATKGKNLRIPEELMRSINQNPNFWNLLFKDKTLQNRFIRSLVEGNRTKVGDFLTTTNPFSTSTLEKKDLEKLGFDRNTAESIYNYLENQYGDRNGKRLWERRNSYLVSPYIPVHQKGGVISTTKQATGTNDTKNIEKFNDPSKTASVEDNWNLSHADKLQLASIAGDIASLVAAIPTGGNPVAGAIGYGSSLTQFGADVSRDGFDLKDLGDLILNLGLDTVSLLPGVGIAGKLGKTAKVVKRSSEVIKRALLLAGATRAISALSNITSGKGTLDDWKALSTGLFAVKGIKNEVQNIKATKYKGKLPKVEGKTKESLKKEYIDAKVKEDPKLLKQENGEPVSWVNKDGKITDYKEAENAIGKKIGLTKFIEAKLATQAAAASSKAKLTNAFSGSYNPFSKNFRWSMINRELPEDFNIRNFSGKTSQLRTLGRLARQNSSIFSALEKDHWLLPKELTFSSNYGGNWFYRSPIFARMKELGVVNQPKVLSPSTGVRDVPVTLSGRKNPIEIFNLDPYLQSVDGSIGLKFYKKGGKIVKAKDGLYFEKQNLGNNTYSNFNVNPVIVTAWEKGVISPQQAQRDARMRLLGEQIIGIDPKNPFKTYNSSIILPDGSLLESTSQSVPLNVQLNRNLRNEAYLNLKNPYRNISIETATNSNTQNQTEDDIVSTGPSNTSEYSFNPKNLLDVTSLIGGLTSNAKQRNEIKKGIIAAAKGQLKSMPTEIYNPYTDMGITRMYDNRIADIRQFKTVTSDSNQAMIERIIRDQQADQLANERDTKLTQTISDYQNKNIAAKREYANQRTQIADYNKSVLGQMKNAIAQNTAVKQFTNWNQIINPFIDQKRIDLVRDQQAEQSAKTIRDNLALQQEMQKKYIDLYNSKQAQDAWLNEQKTNPNWKTEYGDSEAGRKAFLDKYYSGTLQNMQNNLIMRMQLNEYLNERNRFTGGYRTLTIPESTIQDYYRPSSFYTTFANIHKNGGTITKRYRDFDEQSLLDKAKDYRRAVQKMDDNLVKFLLKMFS